MTWRRFWFLVGVLALAGAALAGAYMQQWTWLVLAVVGGVVGIALGLRWPVDQVQEADQDQVQEADQDQVRLDENCALVHRVDELHASGMSIRDACESAGIGKSTYYDWRDLCPRCPPDTSDTRTTSVRGDSDTEPDTRTLENVKNGV